jgi:hypothetical protein
VGAESTVTFLAGPQPVEVHHRDAWLAGALLGWRHDADGTCRLRVSAVVDGYKRTAWVALDTVRLPEPPPGRLVRPVDRGAGTALPALPRPRPVPLPDLLDEPLRPAPA